MAIWKSITSSWSDNWATGLVCGEYYTGNANFQLKQLYNKNVVLLQPLISYLEKSREKGKTSIYAIISVT